MNIKDLPLPNINYEDFYKFVTSFSLIGFIVGITFSMITVIYVSQQFSKSVTIITLSIFLLISAISIASFWWAVKKWKRNQDKLDELLEKEIERKKIETNLKKAQYEAEIHALLEKENISNPGFAKKIINQLEVEAKKRQIEKS